MMNKPDPPDSDELLPLAITRSGSDTISAKSESRGGANDDPSPSLQSTSIYPALSKILFRVLPLVVFAFGIGTYMLGEYENEEALEEKILNTKDIYRRNNKMLI